MSARHDLLILSGGTLLLLAGLQAATTVWCRLARETGGRAAASNFRLRMRSFWWIAAVVIPCLWGGVVPTTLLFAALSLVALGEILAVSKLGARDHRALVWSVYFVVPVQYGLVLARLETLHLVFIPVIALVLVPFLIALSGDPGEFLTRAGTLVWALLTCVHALSFGPALLGAHLGRGIDSSALLFFCILVVQLSDFLQYFVGRRFGRRPLAPTISPGKTVEGFLGGVLGATLVGGTLWWATPFSAMQATVISLASALMGVVGGLTMSAAKRAAGVKDFGTWLSGHGGLLDRADSLCFSLPVFFLLTRAFLDGGLR